MVRRSARLVNPNDQYQAQDLVDLDDFEVIAKRWKAEKATLVRKKRRIERGESTSSADAMIKDAIARSEALLDHEPSLYRNSQLNAQLSEDDPRNSIVARNSLQSPLLSLPAEVRCRVFEYVLGYQHIHIFTDNYDPNTSVDLPGPTRFGTMFPSVSRVYMRRFHNCVFPIEWQSYYRIQEYQSRPNQVPLIRQEYARERVITATNDRMTLFPVVCRQVYHETLFLPYELNEFSFQDETTMMNWFGNRVAAQRRAISTVWFDLEWERSSQFFKKASIHFGKNHGIRKIYVSHGALEHVWSQPYGEWRSKAEFLRQVGVLLRRRGSELQMEFVK